MSSGKQAAQGLALSPPPVPGASSTPDRPSLALGNVFQLAGAAPRDRDTQQLAGVTHHMRGGGNIPECEQPSKDQGSEGCV